MYGYLGAQRRLKSQLSFITNSNATQDPPDQPSVGVFKEKSCKLKYLSGRLNGYY